jgi:hypothetical protein
VERTWESRVVLGRAEVYNMETKCRAPGWSQLFVAESKLCLKQGKGAISKSSRVKETPTRLSVKKHFGLIRENISHKQKLNYWSPGWFHALLCVIGARGWRVAYGARHLCTAQQVLETPSGYQAEGS